MWAKGSYQSIQGKISSDWKIEKEHFKLSVSIPANTRAEVWIRTKPDGEIKESGKLVKANSEIRFIKYEGAYAVVEIGSGDYVFESDLK